MSFWPDEINSDEVLSPREIMQSAGEELQEKTNRLAVTIESWQLDDRTVLAFVVQNRVSGNRLNLFEAMHRLNEPYPVAIEPPKGDLPEFLRDERFVPGTPGLLPGAEFRALAQTVQGTPGRFVKNEWVCSTPSDFQERLVKLFSRNYVKARIVSLMTRPNEKPDDAIDPKTPTAPDADAPNSPRDE